jgi:hypothetical protein
MINLEAFSFLRMAATKRSLLASSAAMQGSLWRFARERVWRREKSFPMVSKCGRTHAYYHAHTLSAVLLLFEQLQVQLAQLLFIDR